MRTTLQILLAIPLLLCFCVGAERTEDVPLSSDAKIRLEKGEAVVLPHRPDESTKIDKRFVTVAKLISGTRAEIWTVINDKEDAENFIDGVLASKVIEEDENSLVVEQETYVGGPKGSYRYKLRHRFTGMERADFTFIEGEIKDVEGAWWIFDWPVEGKFLVLYSLYIDPGVFAPQFIVKSGMKKTMPETFKSIEREVLRRQKGGAEAKR